MLHRTLTLRELNRTYLQRQHLLNRANLGVGDMLSALVGLQAQEVRDPYLALWSRIEGFTHGQLGNALLDRSAVRASLMRGTIHLVTSDDYLLLFPATYSLHLRSVRSVSSARLVPREHHAAIVAQARELLEQQPLSAGQMGEALQGSWPDYDPRSLGQVVRFLLPLVQVPPRGVWGKSGAATWSLASEWLGVSITEVTGPTDEMIRRYLRAFGPASVADMTSWSGVTNLRQTVTEMGDSLVTYRNENGVVLYDLAGMEIADPDCAAPVRFLPGFDNALLGHKDRSRIIPDEYRRMIGTPNGLFVSTFLADGFVAGTWRVNDGRIELAALETLSAVQKEDVEREAAMLAPFWTGEHLPARWAEIWKHAGTR